MTLLRTGGSPKFADGWEKIFGKGSKAGGKANKKSARKLKAKPKKSKK